MKVSILGLGIIGSVWARNLLEDGQDLRCWNRTPKDFPNFVPSITDAVAGSDFVIVVVADPVAVQDVLTSALPVLRAGQTVIQCSTVSSDWNLQFAEQVQATGAAFLEAPFTGSRPAAEARKTVFYTGGDPAVLEHSRPLLQRLASAIIHIGPLGTASALKLAMNVHIAGLTQALCESMAICRAAGIPDSTYFDALQLNAARSGVSDLKKPKLLERDYSPQFSIKHMAKDLRLAHETADKLGLQLPEAECVLKLYDQALENGWADDDYISLERLLS